MWIRARKVKGQRAEWAWGAEREALLLGGVGCGKAGSRLSDLYIQAL